MLGRETSPTNRIWVFIGCGEITARILPDLRKEDVGGLVLIDSDTIEERNTAHVEMFPRAIGKNKAAVLGNYMAKKWGWQLVLARAVPNTLTPREIKAVTAFLTAIPPEWPRETVVIEATDDPRAVRWRAIHVHTGLTSSSQEGMYAISVGAFVPFSGLVRESGRCPEILSAAARQAANRFIHRSSFLISLLDSGYQGFVEIGVVNAKNGQIIRIDEFV